MVTMVSTCVDKLCLLICPGTSRVDLLRYIAINIKSINSQKQITIAQTKDPSVRDFQQMYERLSSSICEALKGQKKRSNELRVLRAVLYIGTSASVR